MKIHKGDKVIVRTGKDKNIVGVVTRSFPQEGKVVVEGVNVKKKHVKSRGDMPGQVLNIAHPIDVSNVMIVDPASSKPSRVGKKKVGDSYVRVAKKSMQELKK